MAFLSIMFKKNMFILLSFFFRHFVVCDREVKKKTNGLFCSSLVFS